MGSKCVFLVSCFIATAYTLPLEESPKTLQSKDVKSPKGINLEPAEQPTAAFNDFANLVEIEEKDIPEGAWVIAVDEPLPKNQSGNETLMTSDNIVFRPLFRYRQRQNIRGTRRRYYAPRRSYRHSYYNNYYYPRYRYPYYYFY